MSKTAEENVGASPSQNSPQIIGYEPLQIVSGLVKIIA